MSALLFLVSGYVLTDTDMYVILLSLIWALGSFRILNEKEVR